MLPRALQSGQYQRWRLVNTGYRRFLDLQILAADTSQPTKQCELLLLAKDGERFSSCGHPAPPFTELY